MSGEITIRLFMQTNKQRIDLKETNTVLLQNELNNFVETESPCVSIAHDSINSVPRISVTDARFVFSVAPAPPSLVKVVRVTRDSATLQWNAPVSDGGAPITNYLIYKRVMPAESWEEVRARNFLLPV